MVYDRVAFLDVHRDSIMACARISSPKGRDEFVKKFGTMTADLLALREWLSALKVTHVGMESTGIYWKPVYYILEEAFQLFVVNPAHMKNVPGRKTDVKDCQWGCQLMECGLLRASFVPPKEIRDLRDLTRYRKELTEERTREVQRLHKVLQDAGVKLSSVASDIMGTSGQEMIQALIQGTRDPEMLAELAQGRLRAKLPALRRALEGRFREHHAFLSSEILSRVEDLETAMERLTVRIGELLRPFAKEMELLMTAPGVKRKTAEVVIAEIGAKVKEQFSSDRHLSSWAGLAPGNHESAGKRKKCKTVKGNKWLQTALVEAGTAAVRKRDTFLGPQSRRLLKRGKSAKSAQVAIAHSLLIGIYHMLSKKEPWKDLGASHYDNRSKQYVERSCTKRLEDLGYEVTLTPKKAAM